MTGGTTDAPGCLTHLRHRSSAPRSCLIFCGTGQPSSAEEIEASAGGTRAGTGLSGGLADSTIRNDTGYLDLIRDWFGRPLREMQPADADACFGRVLRDAKPSMRTGRAAALTVYFQFLELRHKAEICN